MKSTAESPRRRSDGLGGPIWSPARYDGADRGVLLDLDGVIDRAALRDGEIGFRLRPEHAGRDDMAAGRDVLECELALHVDLRLPAVALVGFGRFTAPCAGVGPPVAAEHFVEPGDRVIRRRDEIN